MKVGDSVIFIKGGNFYYINKGNTGIIKEVCVTTKEYVIRLDFCNAYQVSIFEHRLKEYCVQDTPLNRELYCV